MAILPDRHLRPPSLPAFSDIQVAAIQRGELMKNDDDENARAAAARKASPFLDTAQTAHYLGISTRTLAEMRERGEGPPFRKHGRLVRYHIADVEAWLIANRWDRALGRPRKPSDDASSVISACAMQSVPPNTGAPHVAAPCRKSGWASGARARRGKIGWD